MFNSLIGGLTIDVVQLAPIILTSEALAIALAVVVLFVAVAILPSHSRVAHQVLLALVITAVLFLFGLEFVWKMTVALLALGTLLWIINTILAGIAAVSLAYQRWQIQRAIVNYTTSLGKEE